jgi:pyrroloquinoline quinone biosynthesis protein B
LSLQLRQFPDLQPRPQTARNTPIAGVFLTNADLDHVLGLFSLREGGPLNIYAPHAVRTTVEDSIGLQTVLDSFCGSQWHELAMKDFAPLSGDSTRTPALLYRAIELTGGPPPFAKSTKILNKGINSVAYQFLNARTKRKLLVAPDVASLGPELTDALQNSDLILFDGTFWSADELAKVRPDARRASEMGHVTIQDCSLDLLAKLPVPQKVYIHINNTNPLLAPKSSERAAVEAAGIHVGSDGMEFEL